MGIGEQFRAYCSNLNTLPTSTISSRYASITRRLNTDFWVTNSDSAHSLYVGSYGRNTSIRGASDIDVVFWLPWSLFRQYDDYAGNGQSQLLQAVRNSLLTTYSTTRVRGDGQIVCVPFSDGMTFEVLPAFEFDDGSFYYPDTNNGGSWQTTDPREEISAIRARNLAVNGNLLNLCRMIRDWRRTHSVAISGILIDTLAYQFIATWPYRDKSYLYYDWMSRDFFAYLYGLDTTKMYWNAPGSSRRVYRTGQFRVPAKHAYEMACDAIDSESGGYRYAAAGKWRDLYSTSFPYP